MVSLFVYAPKVGHLVYELVWRRMPEGLVEMALVV